MSDHPAPPDPRFIERLEAIHTEHAVTALAPLGHNTERNRVTLKILIRNLEHTVAGFASARAAAHLRASLEAHAGRIQPLSRPGSWYVVTDGSGYEHTVLPETFGPRLMHDTTYYVRPLIQAATNHGEFLLLALSEGRVQLFRMSGETMTPLSLDTLPASLTDVVGRDIESDALQQHRAAGTRLHGQGKGHDDRDKEIEAFLRAVDGALTGDGRAREQHLMIAAVGELAAAYRKLSEHRHLLPCTVTLSPDRTRDEDLRLAARDAFEAWREQDTHDFVAALQDLPEQTADLPETVVRAALEGRVDTLVTIRNVPLWGPFRRPDLVRGPARPASGRQPGPGGRGHARRLASGRAHPHTRRRRRRYHDRRVARPVALLTPVQARRLMTAQATRSPAFPDGCER